MRQPDSFFLIQQVLDRDGNSIGGDSPNQYRLYEMLARGDDCSVPIRHEQSLVLVQERNWKQSGPMD